MTCPIVKAFDSLKSGGWDPDDQTSDENLITGGGDKAYVADDVCYRVNFVTLSVARLEASKPTPDKLRAKLAELFPYYSAGRPLRYNDIYLYLLKDMLTANIMGGKLITMVQKVLYLNAWIFGKVMDAARAGRPINVTIPPLTVPPIRADGPLEPTKIMSVLNGVEAYITGLNLGDLLGKITLPKPELSEPPKPPVMSKEVAVPAAGPDLAIMKALLAAELEVCEYLRHLEKYQCKMINHVNSIYDTLHSLMQN